MQQGREKEKEVKSKEQIDKCTIPNNKKDALVNVKFDNLPEVKNKK